MQQDHEFGKLERLPAYRLVYDAIEGQILSGRLRVGDPLPPEVQLAGQFGVNRSTVREGIRLLEQSGLVTVRRIGTQKHYQANPASPLYSELCSIAMKTVGLAEPLREALAPLAGKIIAAFVYGSIAKRADTSTSDIDLMIVSDGVTYADVYAALEPVSVKLGRTINPTVYTRQQLAKRIKQGAAFATRVLKQPKVWLIGSEDVLAA